jgi:NAD+ synthase
MVPKTVEFRDELPKTTSGKIVRRALREEQERPRAFSAEVLKIDAAAEAARIEQAIRDQMAQLRKKGAVVGMSGGIDSSVVAALCARALGPRRVLGLFMPESDSSQDSLRLARMLAEQLGIETRLEDIGPILQAAGCYQRRNEAIRQVLPEFGDQDRCKIVLPDLVNGAQYAVYSLVTQGPQNGPMRTRLTTEAYLGVVAATNFKQRTRKMIEYYWADRLNFAVAGTPNLLEYEQGFFVKNGDGAADFKPIAHLYKSQVYALAEYLGVPEEIRRRQPTTDTYSLEQSQEEFYFSLPYQQMDVCMWARDHGVPAEEAAAAAGLTPAQAARAYQLIDARRKASRYLHEPPLLVEEHGAHYAHPRSFV